jgi:hypothetical protein
LVLLVPPAPSVTRHFSIFIYFVLFLTLLKESYFTYPPEDESPVDHDILFRPGIAPDGSDTFTPRNLIYDLKGAFGSMKKVGALYEPEDDGSLDQPGVW